ncbi:hypothetical protein LCGC14_1466480, partial [marine sediment metagenome]
MSGGYNSKNASLYLETKCLLPPAPLA